MESVPANKLERVLHMREFFKELDTVFDLYDFNVSTDPDHYAKLGIMLVDSYRDSFKDAFGVPFTNFEE